MGHLFSTPINAMVVTYLNSLQKDGNGNYTVDKYETEFNLNKFPGSDTAPKCHMFVKNSSIQFEGLTFDSTPLSMKSSKVTIEIGEVVVRCDDLGYILRITGRISIFDVFSKMAFTPTFENGIRVSNIGSEATVNNIKSDISLLVNGTDHSRLANVLLSVEDPRVASNLVDAVFMLQKENLLDFLNANIQEIAGQYGF